MAGEQGRQQQQLYINLAGCNRYYSEHPASISCRHKLPTSTTFVSSSCTGSKIPATSDILQHSSLSVQIMFDVVISWHTCQVHFGWLTSAMLPRRALTSLWLTGGDFTTLPPLPSQLQHLNVSECAKLRSLPALPATLEVLCCDECAALTALPNSLSSTAVTELTCNGCISLRRLPQLPECLTELQVERCDALTEVRAN
jgi:hypothetical protein